MRAGGGHNHRGSLSEAVLVKDNHLGGVSITEAVAGARHRWPGRMIEVECDRADQVAEALRAGATVIMLDNMTPEQVAECVAQVRAVGNRDAGGGVGSEWTWRALRPWRRPAPTSSRSGPSPTPPRCSTWDSTCAGCRLPAGKADHAPGH